MNGLVTIPFLNPGAQFLTLRSEILAAVENSLSGGHYILGPNVSSFEKEIASYLGIGNAIGVNSGSDALTLALKALGIGPGDEVITTPFTYIAPAEAIYQVGAKIVFADVHPRTFCIDPVSVESKVTSRTRAIIPVHLFGQAAPLDDLLSIARNRQLRIVEDCAQSIGARRSGKMTGVQGDIGCFSFYPTKNLGADGDGGLCVTADEALAKRLRMLRVHGIERRYHHDLHGFNSRLDDIQAAILRVKLPHLDRWNSRRREIAARYTAGMSRCPIELPLVAEGNESIFHVYALLTDRRDALQQHLTDHGVPTIIYYPLPLHLQRVYSDLGYRTGDFPVTESVSRRILPLPMYPELTDQQVEYVIEQVNRFFV